MVDQSWHTCPIVILQRFFLAGVVPNPIEIIVRLIKLNPMKHHLLGFILLN